jgi:hypothetical protein
MRHIEREERLVLGKNKMKNIIRKRIPLLKPRHHLEVNFSNEQVSLMEAEDAGLR